MLLWMLGFGTIATAFDFYTDTAHGDRSYGVNRAGTGYLKGDCTHCHDTFDQSTCGVIDLMFFAPYGPGSQTDNFCFECHKGAGSIQDQDPALTNYNYSRMASGDISIERPSNILEAFSFINEDGDSVSNCGSDYGTAHKLTDIKNFINLIDNMPWGYTADSNPCTACHIPHLAQRDAHTEGNRGWLVALPSGHASTPTWQLWGDDQGERMDQYTTYQAPNAASGYEPDGSTTQDGSNLTDYVTFCTDCHDDSNTIYSTVLGRDLYTIDWSTEKHGAGVAGDCCDDILPPYQEDQCGNYILSCTDCHEPHGAPNIFLIREKVNNGDVTVLTGTGVGPQGKNSKEWVYLCAKCHGRVLGDSYHTHPTYLPPNTEGCDHEPCHDMHQGPIFKPCGNCHFHGNSMIRDIRDGDVFDEYEYGEPLF